MYYSFKKNLLRLSVSKARYTESRNLFLFSRWKFFLWIFKLSENLSSQTHRESHLPLQLTLHLQNTTHQQCNGRGGIFKLIPFISLYQTYSVYSASSFLYHLFSCHPPFLSHSPFTFLLLQPSLFDSLPMPLTHVRYTTLFSTHSLVCMFHPSLLLSLHLQLQLFFLSIFCPLSFLRPFLCSGSVEVNILPQFIPTNNHSFYVFWSWAEAKHGLPVPPNSLIKLWTHIATA